MEQAKKEIFEEMENEIYHMKNNFEDFMDGICSKIERIKAVKRGAD